MFCKFRMFFCLRKVSITYVGVIFCNLTMCMSSVVHLGVRVIMSRGRSFVI